MTASREEVEPESDNALLESAGRGDREAFGRFYDRVSTPLFSLAVKMLNDPNEAEDALMEGMEAIWRQAPGFDPTRSSAFTWSVMVFRGRVIDRVRRSVSQSRTRERAAMEHEVMEATRGDDFDTGGLMARREEWELVRQAVDSLDEDRATLLRWSFFDGMTHQEISERCGRPLGTVKTVIRRALIELRARITGEGLEP